MRLDTIGDQFAHYLARSSVGILYTAGALPLPVRYHSYDLELECLLPRWSDLAYAIEQRPSVTLIIAEVGTTICWLQYQGHASVADLNGFDTLFHTKQTPIAEGYLGIRIQPRRLDLFDERRGWGARETLEL